MTPFCGHGYFIDVCPFDVTTANASKAWFALTARRALPIDPRSTSVWCSPEAMAVLPRDMAFASFTDPRLRGLEMRLQMAAPV